MKLIQEALEELHKLLPAVTTEDQQCSDVMTDMIRWPYESLIKEIILKTAEYMVKESECKKDGRKYMGDFSQYTQSGYNDAVTIQKLKATDALKEIKDSLK